MSESSLPPFRPARLRLLLKTLRPPRLKERLERLYARRRRGAGTTGYAETPALETRAAQTVREYLDAHAANLERAERLEEKAERLEKAGTPSESARNRAERAHEEVVAGLAALRTSFVEAAGGREEALAFDRAVELLCPASCRIGSRTGNPW
jgi:hypothetical protein